MKKIIMAAMAVLVCGCVHKGAKMTEGTDLSVGISVPGTDGMAQVSILNYLSGFRLGVAKDAEMYVWYMHAETNDYFGVIHTRTYKRVASRVIPVATYTNEVAEVSADAVGEPEEPACPEAK